MYYIHITDIQIRYHRQNHTNADMLNYLAAAGAITMSFLKAGHIVKKKEIIKTKQKIQWIIISHQFIFRSP